MRREPRRGGVLRIDNLARDREFMVRHVNIHVGEEPIAVFGANSTRGAGRVVQGEDVGDLVVFEVLREEGR